MKVDVKTLSDPKKLGPIVIFMSIAIILVLVLLSELGVTMDNTMYAFTADVRTGAVTSTVTVELGAGRICSYKTVVKNSETDETTTTVKEGMYLIKDNKITFTYDGVDSEGELVKDGLTYTKLTIDIDGTAVTLAPPKK